MTGCNGRTNTPKRHINDVAIDNLKVLIPPLLIIFPKTAK